MALPQEVIDSFARIDTATTTAAAYIGELRKKNGITPEQTAEVNAGLAKLESWLNEFGKDPSNPVPPAPMEFTQRNRRS